MFSKYNKFMQLIILFFLFLSSSLRADCTSTDIKDSDIFYMKADKESNKTNQIRFLEKSLNACYAPEIEASLLEVKADLSTDIQEKIDYHLEILGLLSDFLDVEYAFSVQNTSHIALASLYESVDKEIADIYRDKIQKKITSTLTEDKSINYIIFFTLLIVLYIFYPILKQKIHL